MMEMIMGWFQPFFLKKKWVYPYSTHVCWTHEMGLPFCIIVPVATTLPGALCTRSFKVMANWDGRSKEPDCALSIFSSTTTTVNALYLAARTSSHVNKGNQSSGG